jgi:hypothetical protein
VADQIEPVESVTVTVRPSAEHPDILTIEDAMKQVLDFFALLVPDNQERLIWKLEVASTNSPLTVTGRPASFDNIDVSMIARAQRSLVADNFRSIALGVRPRRPLSKQKTEIIRRLLVRNTNGIGQTEAVLDDQGPPVLITPGIAQTGIRTLSQKDDETDDNLFARPARTGDEIGSIEGTLLSVGTEYNQPAVLVRERRSGDEIWCRVNPDLKHRISEESGYEDVWEHRRVLVRGIIKYDAQGRIARVIANSIQVLKPRQMTPHDIRDPGFTDGLTPEAYLERLREGEIGD